MCLEEERKSIQEFTKVESAPGIPEGNTEDRQKRHLQSINNKRKELKMVKSREPQGQKNRQSHQR